MYPCGETDSVGGGSQAAVNPSAAQRSASFSQCWYQPPRCDSQLKAYMHGTCGAQYSGGTGIKLVRPIQWPNLWEKVEAPMRYPAAWAMRASTRRDQASPHLHRCFSGIELRIFEAMNNMQVRKEEEVGYLQQDLIAGTLGCASIRLMSRNRWWYAGLAPATPTTD